jgi:hypothetical protein
MRAFLSVPIATTAFLAGCNNAVFSPPARAIPLESAATLPRGDTGIQAEGSLNPEVLGPNVFAGSVRVRHGVADDVDVEVGGTAMHVDADTKPSVPVSTSIYAVRGGAKIRLASPLSITGGFGGGYSAGGAFVSPDVGPVVAWENRYVVPFLATRLGMSVPISPRSVDTSQEQDGSHTSRPHLTWIFTGIGGVRIPLGWSKNPEGTLRGSLLTGAGMTHLADDRASADFFHLALGGEIVF